MAMPDTILPVICTCGKCGRRITVYKGRPVVCAFCDPVASGTTDYEKPVCRRCGRAFHIGDGECSPEDGPVCLSCYVSEGRRRLHGGSSDG